MRKSNKIEYLQTTISDLQSIIDYISRDLSSPQAANSLLQKIDRSVGRLSEYPFSCEKTKDTLLNNRGYRVLVVENYLIFYIVTEDTVVIRRVLYNKQNYKNILK